MQILNLATLVGSVSDVLHTDWFRIPENYDRLEFWIITKTVRSMGVLVIELESGMTQDESDAVTLASRATTLGTTVDEVTSSVGRWGRLKISWDVTGGAVVSVWVVPKRS